jgi:hypothetical protein
VTGPAAPAPAHRFRGQKQLGFRTPCSVPSGSIVLMPTPCTRGMTRPPAPSDARRCRLRHLIRLYQSAFPVPPRHVPSTACRHPTPGG